MNDTPHFSRPAKRTILLIAVCLAAMTMPLTFSGPAVALPDISRTLGGDPVTINWVTNAYMLTFGSTLMAFGALADTYGRRRVFIGGVTGFALTSLAAICAHSMLVLDLLRAAQGLAAAASFASGMAALAQEFDGPAGVRAFSFVGTGFGAGLSFGPIASAMISRAYGWPSIFLLTVTLTLLSLLLAIFTMRETRDPAAKGLDWPGAASFTLALTMFTFGVLQAPESGWGSPRVVMFLSSAGILLGVFIHVEVRAERPMLDLSLFRYFSFVGVQLLAAAPAYSFVVLLILLPIRFVGIEGISPADAGGMMLVLCSPLLILPLIAGWLTRWLSPGVISGVGLLICACGLTWLGFLPPGSPLSAMLIPLLVIGAGISLPWGLMDGLAVSVVPNERAGMATGIFSTVRVAGEGVALAVVSALLSALTARHFTGPHAREAAQKLVTGDVAGAASLQPDLSPPLIVQHYGSAFSTLLSVLTAVTICTALAVMIFLGGRDKGRRDIAGSDCPEDGLPSASA